MKFQLLAAAMVLAATSTYARIPSQETLDKARRLSSVSQPYIVQVNANAVTYGTPHTSHKGTSQCIQ
jgi:hypothetical protein